MKQIATIGLDLAKQVFQVRGAEVDGSLAVSRKLHRTDVLGFSRSCRNDGTPIAGISNSCQEQEGTLGPNRHSVYLTRRIIGRHHFHSRDEK
jgi:hypothetical protein